MSTLNTDILKQLDITEEEKKFIETAHSGQTATINQSRIISEFYLAKNLKRATDRMMLTLPNEAIRIVQGLQSATDKLIESNERLAQSNENHAKTMNRLTYVLLIFAAIEAIATAAAIFVS